MQVIGVRRVTVRAVEASPQWYADVLGLSAAEDEPGVLDAGEFGLSFGPEHVLTLQVADVAEAVRVLRERGATVDASRGTAVLHDPAGNRVELVVPPPPDTATAEQALSAFIDDQAELAGPPTEELADRAADLVATAQEQLRALLEGVAHNKVLATHLLVGQRARRAEQGTAEQWRLYATSTLLSDLILPAD